MMRVMITITTPCYGDTEGFDDGGDEANNEDDVDNNGNDDDDYNNSNVDECREVIDLHWQYIIQCQQWQPPQYMVLSLASIEAPSPIILSLKVIRHNLSIQLSRRREAFLESHIAAPLLIFTAPNQKAT